MYDGIEFRGFAHQDVEDLAQHGPVWNALTDRWHPTQMLADMLTMRDHSQKPLEAISYCYIGDARNNTANSLLITGALLGMDARICRPRELWPDEDIVALARHLAKASGARLTVSGDLEEAVPGADYLYTDAWVSMGEPTETWANRIEKLRAFQISSRIMALTGNGATKFMHCLPAMHNRDTELGEPLLEKFGRDALEVTDEVFESPASIVLDQAENRLRTIKAVMVATLEKPRGAAQL